jgi:hypothetical protein
MESKDEDDEDQMVVFSLSNAIISFVSTFLSD